LLSAVVPRHRQTFVGSNLRVGLGGGLCGVSLVLLRPPGLLNFAGSLFNQLVVEFVAVIGFVSLNGGAC